MKYIIIKKITVEAETLEEAIQNHDKGQTTSLTAEELPFRTDRSERNTTPIPPRSISSGNRPRP